MIMVATGPCLASFDDDDAVLSRPEGAAGRWAPVRGDKVPRGTLRQERWARDLKADRWGGLVAALHTELDEPEAALRRFVNIVKQGFPPEAATLRRDFELALTLETLDEKAAKFWIDGRNGPFVLGSGQTRDDGLDQASVQVPGVLASSDRAVRTWARGVARGSGRAEPAAGDEAAAHLEGPGVLPRGRDRAGHRSGNRVDPGGGEGDPRPDGCPGGGRGGHGRPAAGQKQGARWVQARRRGYQSRSVEAAAGRANPTTTTEARGAS